jgi:hypothetical protein
MNRPRDSSGKSHRHHCRNVRLQEQHNHYRHHYPPFTIPSSYYTIVYVHRFTAIDTIETLLNHFESCYRYSIDTESDRFTYELSLVQVQSIPRQLPSLIVLFELNHFPSSDSLLMKKIRSLFHLLFRLENTIFSWGPMHVELKPAISMNLFKWPVSGLLINLQDEFSSWYRGALPPCEACRSNQLSNTSKFRCTCMDNYPYAKLTDLWSLQNAICYTINRFLDKSSTRKNWSALLDPNYSSLSSLEQSRRTNYAIYDCVAVTFLHRAVYDKWTLMELREAELTSLFTSDVLPPLSSLPAPILLENISEDESEAELTSLVIPKAPPHSSSLILSTLLEDISEGENEEDDEIFVSSLSSQFRMKESIDPLQNAELTHGTLFDNDITDPAPLNQPLIPDEQPKSRRTCRSAEARTRRNRKRNQALRPYRDQHVIYREVYYRFTLKQVKNILSDLGIRGVHLKPIRSTNFLSIGMKKDYLVDLYFDRLPGDLFDKKHYQQYRRHKH